jgi:phospholipid/cholesterol/gamma-HCH transport system substrate-binding protein
MIFGKTKLEMRLGIFVFIGLVIFAVFILSVGGVKTWTSRYKVSFVFNFINGVRTGAPVRFSGYDAGEVKSIRLFYDKDDSRPKVLITCWVSNDVKIPVDSKVWINTLGLLGEKYIEIMPGTNYKIYMPPEGEIAGEDPIPMNDIFNTAKKIVDTIDEGVNRIMNKEGSVGKILYDDKLYNEIDALITDLRNNPWKIFWKAKEKK